MFLLLALIIFGFVLIILEPLFPRKQDESEKIKHQRLMREIRRHKNEE